MSEPRTVVEDLYEAYFAGNVEGMLSTMSNEVEVRFLGRGLFRGIDEARIFLAANTAKLVDLDFRIRGFVVDGQFVAVIWDETAMTVYGDHYQNHGVDVFRVERDKISVLHENNDVLVHRAAFGGGSHTQDSAQFAP